MSDITNPRNDRPELLFSADICGSPAAIACHQDGQWLAVGTAAGDVVLYNTFLNSEVTRRTAHKIGLHAIHWHPTAMLLATSGRDGFARIWSIDDHGTMTKLHELKTGQDWVEHLAWRSDGKQLAIASGKDIRLFSEQGELQGAYRFPHSSISALRWRQSGGPGAQLAAAGYGGVMIYNVLDPNLKPRKLNCKGLLLNIEWSPDGQVVAAGCQDNTLHFWRLKDDNGIQLSGYVSKPKQLSWSANSRFLVSSGTRDLIIWAFDGKGPEGREPIILPYHEKPVTVVAFAPKGQWLAAGCKEGKLSIWQKVAADSPAYTLQGKTGIEHLAWVSTKTTLKLVAITQNGILGMWQI